jgi:hypothetical protein
VIEGHRHGASNVQNLHSIVLYTLQPLLEARWYRPRVNAGQEKCIHSGMIDINIRSMLLWQIIDRSNFRLLVQPLNNGSAIVNHRYILFSVRSATTDAHQTIFSSKILIFKANFNKSWLHQS